jgi:uncharacterized protein YjaZ
MNGVFDMDLWEEYANRISSGLPEKFKHDSSDYNFENDIIPVMKLVMSSRAKLESIHNSFLKATKNLSEKIKNVFGVELKANIILYLGLCNGAGWATELKKKPVVLLGIEKIIELDWCDYKSMASLIYHELGHIWHDEAGGFQGEEKIAQLYREGIATYFEQLIAGDFNYYRQNKNDWSDWCCENLPALKTEYLRRLNTNESTREFFGDWHNYQGYCDVGYYIGCEFVKWLSQKYSLTELAKLDSNTVYKEFQNFAEKHN